MEEEDFEKEFFMRNNIMKEYSAGFVIYIQEELSSNWKDVLRKHLTTQKTDKCRVIFKTDGITITLYEKPKKDPRSKLHIQSGDQSKNLEFIMDKLSLFYREVCLSQPAGCSSIELKEMQRAHCGKCGKQFTNKKG